MSDFFNPATTPKARKRHQCVCCYAGIPAGEQYVQQTGFYDGRPFRNKFHQECWDILCEDGEFEFTPGDGEPPERLLVPQDQQVEVYAIKVARHD